MYEDLRLKLGRSVAAGENELDAIPRGRYRLGLESSDRGCDIWQAHEAGFLLPTGLPCMGRLRFFVDGRSAAVVESKSMKLFLVGLTSAICPDESAYLALVQKSLEAMAVAPVRLEWLPLSPAESWPAPTYWGELLEDRGDVLGSLAANPAEAAGGLVLGPVELDGCWSTHLFRSLCPVTGQPDWASVRLSFAEARVDPAALLPYLLAFRNHAGFHETCCERMLVDLFRAFRPQALQVDCHFSRRGGIDIAITRHWPRPLRPCQPFPR
jgi:7-cyano-7-deazaguanine reductase